MMNKLFLIGVILLLSCKVIAQNYACVDSNGNNASINLTPEGNAEIYAEGDKPYFPYRCGKYTVVRVGDRISFKSPKDPSLASRCGHGCTTGDGSRAERILNGGSQYGSDERMVAR